MIIPTYRLDALRVLLAPFSGNEALNDPASPRHAAAEWLANKDPMQLDLGETPLPELLQRYVVVLLYFSTNGVAWKNRLDFLWASSVCEWNNVADGPQGSYDGVICDEEDTVVQIFLGKNLFGATMLP